MEAKISGEMEIKASMFCKVVPGTALDERKEGRGRMKQRERERRTRQGRASWDAPGDVHIAQRNFLLERVGRASGKFGFPIPGAVQGIPGCCSG